MFSVIGSVLKWASVAVLLLLLYYVARMTYASYVVRQWDARIEALCAANGGKDVETRIYETVLAPETKEYFADLKPKRSLFMPSRSEGVKRSDPNTLMSWRHALSRCCMKRIRVLSSTRSALCVSVTTRFLASDSAINGRVEYLVLIQVKSETVPKPFLKIRLDVQSLSEPSAKMTVWRKNESKRHLALCRVRACRLWAIPE